MSRTAPSTMVPARPFDSAASDSNPPHTALLSWGEQEITRTSRFWASSNAYSTARLSSGSQSAVRAFPQILNIGSIGRIPDSTGCDEPSASEIWDTLNPRSCSRRSLSLLFIALGALILFPALMRHRICLVHQNFATLHHPADVVHDHADVRKRVALDRHEVRIVPRCDLPYFFLHSQRCGTVHRGGGNRLRRRHSGFD